MKKKGRTQNHTILCSQFCKEKKKQPKMLIRSYFCVVEESDFNCYNSQNFPSSLQGICILY